MSVSISRSTDSAQISENKECVNQLWSDLKDLADARSLALAAAKEIHTFDRDAGDAKERVQVRGKFIYKYHTHVLLSSPIICLYFHLIKGNGRL